MDLTQIRLLALAYTFDTTSPANKRMQQRALSLEVSICMIDENPMTLPTTPARFATDQAEFFFREVFREMYPAFEMHIDTWEPNEVLWAAKEELRILAGQIPQHAFGHYGFSPDMDVEKRRELFVHCIGNVATDFHRRLALAPENQPPAQQSAVGKITGNVFDFARAKLAKRTPFNPQPAT